MRLPILCLVAGGALGGLVARWYSAERPGPLQIRIPFAVVTEIPEPARPSVRTVRVGCTEAPERIGAPLAKLPPEKPVRTWWRLATARDGCVIAAWQGATIVASRDDGATFTPIVESKSLILGAAVRADGTIFVMREDFTLAIVRPDGSATVRTLAFRGAERGELRVRGRWLVAVTDTGPAISDDEGVSWRHLEWDGAYLVDLQILDGGAIVALADISGDVCDHFDCHGPTQKHIETHLDGRAWRPASRRHARALDVAYAAGLPGPHAPRANYGEVLDSHGLVVGVAGDDSIVRHTRSGWRVLFGGTP